MSLRIGSQSLSVPLGSAKITSGSPASPFVNSTTPIAVPGLSWTGAVGAVPIIVEFSATIQTITANATGGTYYLYMDGAAIDSRGFNMPAVQFGGLPVSMTTLLTPTAGTHTFAIYASTGNAANTWWFNASATQFGTLAILPG